MSSYSGNPQTTPKDAVRFEIYDTSEPFVFNDQEVLYAIEQNAGSIYFAAADLLDRRVREFDGLRSKSIGGFTETYDAKFFQDAADRLRSRGEVAAVVASGGGTPFYEPMNQVFSKGQFDQSSKGPKPRDYDRYPYFEGDEYE